MAQEIATFVIVGLAAANLVRIWGGSLKSSGGCGSCNSNKSCASKAPEKASAPQLVQLQVNLKPKGE